MSSKKIQFELLMDYINGRLNSEEYTSLKTQIDNDPILQKMIAVIEGTKDEADQIDWKKIQNPTHVLFDCLLNDIQKRDRGADKKRGVTIFDSGLLPLADGVRPAEVDTRRLKYIIGEAQLELSIYPVSPKSFEIIGLVSGPEPSQTVSIELKGGKSSIKSEANEFNLFRIRRVSAGKYSMRILDDGNVIGNIDLEL